MAVWQRRAPERMGARGAVFHFEEGSRRDPFCSCLEPSVSPVKAALAVAISVASVCLSIKQKWGSERRKKPALSSQQSILLILLVHGTLRNSEYVASSKSYDADNLGIFARFWRVGQYETGTGGGAGTPLPVAPELELVSAAMLTWFSFFFVTHPTLCAQGQDFRDNNIIRYSHHHDRYHFPAAPS